ncbi:MAG: hypothetical protein AB2784_08280 [Candidatus Thiodiazotropha endolucinida]
MTDVLSDYFEALDRLKNYKSIIVPPGSRISNDTVALEAGRGRGSIKKSRPAFTPLIKAINDAAKAQALTRDDTKIKAEKHRNTADKYRQLWEEALSRELSLILELHELKTELSKLKSNKISSY